jgi:hypothetical protein
MIIDSLPVQEQPLMLPLLVVVEDDAGAVTSSRS